MKKRNEEVSVATVSSDAKQPSKVLQEYKKDREQYENSKKQLPAKGN